ncbi:MAG: Re/Si-specific NAD(P)(+) transhydrogenase subunit alpha [Terriglobia bacterium]
MIIGVPREFHSNEQRVALVPAVVPALAKAGFNVLLEKGAGEKAGFPDAAYQAVGARLAADRKQLFSSAEVLLQVRPLAHNPTLDSTSLARMSSGQLLIGLLNPLGAPQAVPTLAETGVTAFALELLPRITRAQPMDALTSMATLAGYKAVLLAASTLKKMYPMMITAAGTITPAKVFVVGAGVAGLQAIATAHRLGAVVTAYDVRPAVKEQVESLGAKFVELELKTEAAETAGGYAQALGEEFYRRQAEMMARVVADSDVVITTAAVPGKKAPVLITEEAVRKMRPGSVIIDLAAEAGGNCALTRPGETVDVNGVTLLGPLNLPATLAYHASQMYARNVTAFLHNLVPNGALRLNLEDPIIRDTLTTHQGEVVHSQVRQLLGLPARAAPSEERSRS